MQIWLTILASWPEPDGAQQLAHARIGRDHRLGAAVGRRIAAAHHGEHAVLGAGLAAGHRRIDEIEAALLRLGVKLARDLGRGGGVIDEHRALAHAVERAVVAERDLAHVVVVADAHHHEVLAGRGLLRRRGFLAAVLRDPFVGLGGGAIVDGDLVAALVLEMPGHRIAHHAEAEKCHFRHRFLQLSRYVALPINILRSRR